MSNTPTAHDFAAKLTDTDLTACTARAWPCLHCVVLVHAHEPTPIATSTCSHEEAASGRRGGCTPGDAPAMPTGWPRGTQCPHCRCHGGLRHSPAVRTAVHPHATGPPQGGPTQAPHQVQALPPRHEAGQMRCSKSTPRGQLCGRPLVQARHSAKGGCTGCHRRGPGARQHPVAPWLRQGAMCLPPAPAEAAQRVHDQEERGRTNVQADSASWLIAHGTMCIGTFHRSIMWCQQTLQPRAFWHMGWREPRTARLACLTMWVHLHGRCTAYSSPKFGLHAMVPTSSKHTPKMLSPPAQADRRPGCVGTCTPPRQSPRTGSAGMLLGVCDSGPQESCGGARPSHARFPAPASVSRCGGSLAPRPGQCS